MVCYFSPMHCVFSDMMDLKFSGEVLIKMNKETQEKKTGRPAWLSQPSLGRPQARRAWPPCPA